MLMPTPERLDLCPIRGITELLVHAKNDELGRPPDFRVRQLP